MRCVCQFTYHIKVYEIFKTHYNFTQIYYNYLVSLLVSKQIFNSSYFLRKQRPTLDVSDIFSRFLTFPFIHMSFWYHSIQRKVNSLTLSSAHQHVTETEFIVRSLSWSVFRSFIVSWEFMLPSTCSKFNFSRFKKLKNEDYRKEDHIKIHVTSSLSPRLCIQWICTRLETWMRNESEMWDRLFKHLMVLAACCLLVIARQACLWKTEEEFYKQLVVVWRRLSSQLSNLRTRTRYFNEQQQLKPWRCP